MKTGQKSNAGLTALVMHSYDPFLIPRTLYVPLSITMSDWRRCEPGRMEIPLYEMCQGNKCFKVVDIFTG